MTSDWTPIFFVHKIPRIQNIQNQVIDRTDEIATAVLDDLIKTKKFEFSDSGIEIS